jgi:glycosyltransferase involved in cell wall biosynthesis
LNEGPTDLEEFILRSGLIVHRIPYRGKKDFVFCFWKVYLILKKSRTDIVHAHLFEACLIGLPAAFLAGVKKRIHTRHNATYHIKYHPWAVKYDKLINKLSTHIIAISENVKNIMIKYENASAKKIQVIYHGFDFNYISNISTHRIENIKKKYGIPSNVIIIGVISRYIEWKGVQFIIPAIKKFMEYEPSSFLILANTEGPYEFYIRALLNTIPNDKYKEIKFEPDVFALFRCFDYFIHVPVDLESEAFGLVYIEAMASKIPTVITLSGVVSEFAEHKKNTYVVPYNDSEKIYHSLTELHNQSEQKDWMVNNAYVEVKRRFDICKLINYLERLYE